MTDTPTHSRFVDTALELLELGLRPIPIKPNSKLPCEPWREFQKRDPTEEEILQWGEKYPDANIANITGVGSGVDCLDIDHGAPSDWPPHDCPLPSSCVVATPSRGTHRWFKHIEGSRNTAGKIAENVDYRSEGGYALVPYSVINGKPYRYICGSLAEALEEEAPSWLVKEVLDGRPPERKSPEQNPAIDQVIPKGQRNATLTSLAGSMCRRGMSKDAILQALLTENAKRCKPPLEEIEVRNIAGSVARYSPEGDGRNQRTRERNGLPTILITTDIESIVDATEAALMNCPDHCGIYQRAGCLVRVTRGPVREPNWLERPPGTPVIERIQVETLREKMASSAAWVSAKTASARKVELQGQDEKERPALPPCWVARTLEARASWQFPFLEGVSDVPVLRKDGTIWTSTGYDPETGVLCLQDERMEREATCLEAHPDPVMARKALDYLTAPFEEFPFVGACDRAACLAAVLTILGRSLVRGPCPLFAVRAPAAGTGKSLLVDVISLIATGRTPPRLSAGRNDDEDRKRILSIALEGPAVILLDNVTHALDSAPLAAALTGEEIKDRLLGLNRMVTVPLRSVWFATGNNLAFGGDLGRRVVPIDLDARVELPEERTGWKWPDLREHVREDRPALVVAGLTVLRAWTLRQSQDQKKPSLAAFGSFEGWSDSIRACLAWVGEPDPCGGRIRVREEGDVELEALRSLLVAWHEIFQEQPVTVRRMLDKAQELAEGGDSVLKDALPPGRKSEATTKALGYFLRRYRGRIVNGLRLEKIHKGNEGNAWVVRKVDQR